MRYIVDGRKCLLEVLNSEIPLIPITAIDAPYLAGLSAYLIYQYLIDHTLE